MDTGLAREEILHIVSWLTIPEVCTLRFVSQYMKNIAEDDAVWRYFVTTLEPTAGPPKLGSWFLWWIGLKKMQWVAGDTPGVTLSYYNREILTTVSGSQVFVMSKGALGPPDWHTATYPYYEYIEFDIWSRAWDLSFGVATAKFKNSKRFTISNYGVEWRASGVLNQGGDLDTCKSYTKGDIVGIVFVSGSTHSSNSHSTNTNATSLVTKGIESLHSNNKETVATEVGAITTAVAFVKNRQEVVAYVTMPTPLTQRLTPTTSKTNNNNNHNTTGVTSTTTTPTTTTTTTTTTTPHTAQSTWTTTMDPSHLLHVILTLRGAGTQVRMRYLGHDVPQAILTDLAKRSCTVIIA
eukprot:TRINITY_DN4688_c1_g3_i1.p1 TRINITY_DN4688_c1_g3~~TRINITY_DN4688_c1_g3_i1.p1  ORF type:complete len:361 (-),score=77.81 TRINITY_DN4688_c1_g3_i1:41-1093(-)